MAKSHQKLIEAYVKAFTSLRPGNIDTLLALQIPAPALWPQSFSDIR